MSTISGPDSVELRLFDPPYITGSLVWCGDKWDFLIQQLNGIYYADFFLHDDFGGDHFWCYRTNLLDVFKEIADFGGFIESQDWS